MRKRHPDHRSCVQGFSPKRTLAVPAGTIRDVSVAQALIDGARQWLRSRSIDQWHDPVPASTIEKDALHGHLFIAQDYDGSTRHWGSSALETLRSMTPLERDPWASASTRNPSDRGTASGTREQAIDDFRSGPVRGTLSGRAFDDPLDDGATGRIRVERICPAGWTGCASV